MTPADDARVAFCARPRAGTEPLPRVQFLTGVSMN